MEKQLELRDDFEQELDWLLKQGLITKETSEDGREVYKITEAGVRISDAAKKAEDEGARGVHPMGVRMSGSTIYKLTLVVHMSTRSTLKPKLGFDQETIVGFEMPDGRIIRPIFAVEIDKGNDQYEDVTHESELNTLGIQFLDYGVPYGFEKEEG